MIWDLWLCAYSAVGLWQNWKYIQHAREAKFRIDPYVLLMQFFAWPIGELSEDIARTMWNIHSDWWQNR